MRGFTKGIGSEKLPDCKINDARPEESACKTFLYTSAKCLGPYNTRRACRKCGEAFYEDRK